MGVFKDFFDNFFDIDTGVKLTAKDIEILLQTKELVYNKYAQTIVAKRYASALASCLFTTYQQNEVIEGDNYYRLNVEPNPNQSSSEFKAQLVDRLIFDGEALIIQVDNGSLFVAKSFQKNDKQLISTSFTNVVVDVYEDGDCQEYNLTGTFNSDKSIYIKLGNKDALRYINSMNDLYTKLIENVRRSGSNAIKYALGIDTTAINGLNIDIDKYIDQIVNEDFEKLASNEKHAILPLFNGFDLKVLNPANNNAQNSTTASQNINSMFEDILINVGLIYNVPKSFMLGTFEKNDEDFFLTYGIDPMATTITEAFNRRYYTKKQYLEGTYCSLNTKKVKHFDILTVSDAINKLISSGVYSINEVRELLDEQPIEPEIGDKHWVTRNYAVVGDYLQEQSNYTANDPKTQVGNKEE